MAKRDRDRLDDFDRDLLDIIPERFDADYDSHEARKGYRLRSALTLVLAVLAVGGIVAVGLKFMGGGALPSPGVPVIRADDRPIKIRPDPSDRGGMQVPNQDKLVYERMESGTEGGAPVERLLPPPEAPKALPKPAAPPPPAAATASRTAPTPPPAQAEPPAPRAAQPPDVSRQSLPPPAAAPAAPAAPAAAAPPPQVAAAAPAPAPALPKAALTPGDYLVQLGALRSSEAADKEWQRIQKSNADLLGSLRPDIIRVDLGDKGTFWRLRAGPLSDQSARSLCQDLKNRNQGCIIAHK